jgi:hypothetical protein
MIAQVVKELSSFCGSRMYIIVLARTCHSTRSSHDLIQPISFFLKIHLNISFWVAPYFRRSVPGFPSRRPGFEPRSSHMGFVTDKVAFEQVLPVRFGFFCQFSFHWLLHIHYHHLSSGTGTVGQTVTDVLSLTPPQVRSILWTTLTYLLTYGAETFLRSCQLCSHSGNSQQY